MGPHRKGLWSIRPGVDKGDLASRTAKKSWGQTSDFTESEKEIKLSFLGLLSEFPMLWKVDHPLYLDKGAKKKAWQDILSEMKAKHGEKKLAPHNVDSVDGLHAVYEVLRAGLRRVHSVQKRKIKMGEVQGGNSIIYTFFSQF